MKDAVTRSPMHTNLSPNHATIISQWTDRKAEPKFDFPIVSIRT